MAAVELKKLLYRYDETARLVSLSVQSVRRLVEQGDLMRIYVMKREPRITAESIAEYLNRKNREQTRSAETV
jgi:hypothetical protein